MILKFLCDCTHDIETFDQDDVGWWKEISTDRGGFLICVAHHQRSEGWRSFPTAAGKIGLDWDYASFSPLQLEQYFVFGKPLPESKAELEPSAMEDRRDNRDPELIGLEILSKNNGKSKKRVISK